METYTRPPRGEFQERRPTLFGRPAAIRHCQFVDCLWRRQLRESRGFDDSRRSHPCVGSQEHTPTKSTKDFSMSILPSFWRPVPVAFLFTVVASALCLTAAALFGGIDATRKIFVDEMHAV